MPSLSSLTSSLISQVSQRKVTAYLIELTDEGAPDLKEDGLPSQIAFQYFPESITDTKATNYQQKEIPGGSLPLYQWVSGGERLINFTAQFTCDVDLITAQGTTGLTALVSGASTIRDRLKAAGVDGRNVDIRAAIGWLRRFVLPTYDNGGNKGQVVEGYPLTKAPSKLRLVMPNSGIGLAGGSPTTPHSVRVVMTQCDVTYDAFFPSGLPRVASVQLGFAEVPQYGGYIDFPSASDHMFRESDITFGYYVMPKTKAGK